MVHGYQDTTKPQSDSPTVSKESFKMLVAVAANKNFKFALELLYSGNVPGHSKELYDDIKQTLLLLVCNMTCN